MCLEFALEFHWKMHCWQFGIRTVHAIDRSVESHLFVCDRIKNADPSGIGKIGCGGSRTSDIRRGRADTVILLSSPLSIISLVSSS